MLVAQDEATIFLLTLQARGPEVVAFLFLFFPLFLLSGPRSAIPPWLFRAVCCLSPACLILVVRGKRCRLQGPSPGETGWGLLVLLCVNKPATTPAPPPQALGAAPPAEALFFPGVLGLSEPPVGSPATCTRRHIFPVRRGSGWSPDTQLSTLSLWGSSSRPVPLTSTPTALELASRECKAHGLLAPVQSLRSQVRVEA